MAHFFLSQTMNAEVSAKHSEQFLRLCTVLKLSYNNKIIKTHLPKFSTPAVSTCWSNLQLLQIVFDQEKIVKEACFAFGNVCLFSLEKCFAAGKTPMRKVPDGCDIAT